MAAADRVTTVSISRDWLQLPVQSMAGGLGSTVTRSPPLPAKVMFSGKVSLVKLKSTLQSAVTTPVVYWLPLQLP